jgi:hypothetical protein
MLTAPSSLEYLQAIEEFDRLWGVGVATDAQEARMAELLALIESIESIESRLRFASS